MSTKETGGPAFPTPYHPKDAIRTSLPGGMTLRDYFAAKALPKAIEHWDEWHKGDENPNPATDWSYSCVLIAEDAYKMADAMLRERDSDI